MPMITILTPTYNRAGYLSRLYKSLCKQTVLDFEWLLVDDGSTDKTSILIESFNQDLFKFRYLYKFNGGKHTALNLGVEQAEGEYIFIVDSDDCLPSNSIETIIKEIKYIKTLNDFEEICGVCGEKQNITEDEFKISFDKPIVCTPIDFRYKYKIKGDKAEVFKKSILLEYKFPEFFGEKFCPEALVWERISLKYKIYYFPKIIYYCEYLENGLTNKITEARIKSPNATLLYYKELSSNAKIPYIYRVKGIANYIRFKILSNIYKSKY